MVGASGEGRRSRHGEAVLGVAVGSPWREGRNVQEEGAEGRSVGKVGKGEESVGGSGTGASFKELTGRKEARKGRGGVGGKGGKEEGVAGACAERSSVACLENEVKAHAGSWWEEAAGRSSPG